METKPEIDNKPEFDNINIFRHHPHIAKSITDETDSSAVSGGEPDELGGIETLSDDSDQDTLFIIENEDQEMDKWTEVWYRKKNRDYTKTKSGDEEKNGKKPKTRKKLPL